MARPWWDPIKSGLIFFFNFRVAELDLIACLLTFITCILLGEEYGIIVGVGISTGGILMRLLKPKVQENIRTDEFTGTEYFMITPDSGLVFPSVDFVRTRMQKLGQKHKSIKTYFLNFEKWTQADYTAATALVFLVKGFEKNHTSLQFINCSESWVEVLQNAGLSAPPLLDQKDIHDYLRKSVMNVTLNLQNAEMIITSPPNLGTHPSIS